MERSSHLRPCSAAAAAALHPAKCPPFGPSRLERLLSGLTLLCLAAVADAIEGPKPNAPVETPAPPPVKSDIQATDETGFFETLQRVTHFRNLRGLNVAPETIDALAKAQPQLAVATLTAAADQGSREANIALVRIQHWCGQVVSMRSVDPEAQLAKIADALPAERVSRLAGVMKAEADFLSRARAGCTQASFDYGAIEARLREAAAAGDPPSATELSQFVRDPKKRQALVQAAISKNYAPAMYAAATQLLIAVQRGETTENVGSIRLWLKQAGRAVPKAKVDLANCMALGCDGHPADSLQAQAFGIDAARDGEPTAFLSMVRMPWGGRIPRTQKLAWQYFGDRLNEAGCMGDAYVPSSIAFAQALAVLEKGQDAKVLEAARTQAEALWQDNSARAKQENGCR
jgi:hypothetical protein